VADADLSYWDPVLMSARVRDAALAVIAPADGQTPSSSSQNGDGLEVRDVGQILRFKYGGKIWTVDLLEVSTLFSLGSIVMTQSFDPRLHPNVELYGLPEPMRAYILSLGVLRPGRYNFQLNLVADLARLTDFVYDSAAPGVLAGQTPGGGNFGGGNTVKTFQTLPIPCAAFQNVTAFFDNEATALSGTYNLLGYYDPNAGSPGVPLATGTLANNSEQAAGADLTKVIVPYIIAQIVFASAPTAGFVRIIPFGKRGT